MFGIAGHRYSEKVKVSQKESQIRSAEIVLMLTDLIFNEQENNRETGKLLFDSGLE